MGKREATPLEVEAAVHQQFPEQQWGVSRGAVRGVLGRDLWRTPRGARFGPGHELNDR